jgi:hypothetical protein
MGRGRVLRRAIQELKELSPEAPERALALPLLLRLRVEVPADPAERTRDDEEFYMSTQDIVENLIEQGRRQGLEEGAHRALLTLYTTRFGEPPRTIVAAVQGAKDLGALDGWLSVFATGSPSEIAAAVHGPAPRRRVRQAKRS